MSGVFYVVRLLAFDSIKVIHIAGCSGDFIIVVMD